MNRIHLLSEDTINKIAAGEVVERPASALKEILENALDAGADKIEVESLSGGRFLRVTDNGCGMNREEAEMAILRHATSKIASVADLDELSTLGFRGEALPSIAAVSKFTLITRPKTAELGTKIVISGGKLLEKTDIGCPVGTTVLVEDLFFNTPARKKFLKTDNTENNKINECVLKLALSQPQLQLKLINNKKIGLLTNGQGDLSVVLTSVYGAEVRRELLPLSYQDGDISVSGFIGKPSLLKGNRRWQTFFVNGRLITNRLLHAAVDKAYHSLLPKGGYPFVLLFLTLPGRDIDINVHPQKAEVKFADESFVFRSVHKAVFHAITGGETANLGDYAAPVPQFLEKRTQKENVVPNSSLFSPTTFSEATAPLFSASPSSQSIKKEDIYALKNIRYLEAQPVQAKQMPEKVSSVASAGGETVEQVRESAPIEEKLAPLGQIDLCYIVAQGKEGMYLVDQHAAHERILYDRLSGYADKVLAQELLFHEVISLSPEEYNLVAEQKAIFAEFGFQVELAGEKEVRLMTIPADLQQEEALATFQEILTRLESDVAPTRQEIKHHCIAVSACRAAIKAGDRLTTAQMEMILEELLHAKLPYTCPHGRPTLLRFTHYDLAKMFKRVM